MIAPNAMRRHRTANVTEAIAFALELKSAGTYDWFRGQINDWSLSSSLTRVKYREREEVTNTLERFIAWIQDTPGLESLLGNLDLALAVGQHYGIQTHFVDFTTEPRIAGFFASHGRYRKGTESCIICLNTDDLRRFWSEWLSDHKSPEFLKLDVPNLWRLEAQFGTFLYCPYPNIETVYDLDRIVFPYTGPVNEPTVNDIYPVRKSNLELLLDQFFMNETLIAGHRLLESMPVPVRSFNIGAGGYDPDLVKGQGPPAHPSWDPLKINLWLTPAVETISNATTDDKWEFEIVDENEPSLTARSIRSEVARRLNAAPLIRSKLILWQFSFTRGSNRKLKGKVLSEAVQRLWDGLRTLPHTTEDLAEGIGSCVALYLSHLGSTSAGYDPRLHEAFVAFGDDALEVEFGASDGSYSRAYVSTSRLRQAVRHDIAEYLRFNDLDRLLANMTGLLQAVNAPSRLFDFERLATIFAREIAPSQVLSRFAGDSKRPSSPVFFSPARLDKFGLP